MKITQVDTIPLRLPVVREIGDGCQSVLIVQIRTDEGIVGTGEVHTNPLVSKAIIDAPLCSSSANGLRNLLLGEDPRDIGRLWDKMYRHSATYGRRGALMHAISGIDIALWDILGQAAGLPIHRLLGGARRSMVKAYASDLSQDSLEATLAQARRHRDNGYLAMKFGWGALGANPRSDARAAAEIRAAVGDDIDIMFDIGVPMPFNDALYLGKALAESGVAFLEEPLAPDDLRGFAALVAASPTPIATGEKETTQFPYLDLMDRGNLRIVQPDVARIGGITPWIKTAHLAEGFDVPVCPHFLMELHVSLCAAVPNAAWVEFIPQLDDITTSRIRVEGGYAYPPMTAGLGIDWDWAQIAARQVAELNQSN